MEIRAIDEPAVNTKQVFSIDPTTGASERLPWTTELPDWQRVAP